jgi:prepilin-type processing-associated H-X9-DG protein
MGQSLAAVQAPAGIVYLQELRWLTGVAWLRPFCASPTNCVDWCYWGRDGRPNSSHHMEGVNLVYLDGHARYKKSAAIRSGDFGLIPADDHQGPKGVGHTGVCGKRYSRQL